MSAYDIMMPAYENGFVMNGGLITTNYQEHTKKHLFRSESNKKIFVFRKSALVWAGVAE